MDNLTLHLNQLEKEEQKNPKVNRCKEIIKIRGEIKEKEMKGTIAKINKTKSWFFEKIKQTNHQPDSSRKKKKKKSTTEKQSQQKKEIIKTKAEINEKQMKGKIVKINKIKSRSFEKLNKIA